MIMDYMRADTRNDLTESKSLQQVKVIPGEKEKIHILVKGNVPEGFYGVKVSVRSESTGNIIDNVMRIRVGEGGPDAPPSPNFDVDVSVPAQMDPRGKSRLGVSACP